MEVISALSALGRSQLGNLPEGVRHGLTALLALLPLPASQLALPRFPSMPRPVVPVSLMHHEGYGADAVRLFTPPWV